MNILIIEDEKPAANNLIRLLSKELPEASILGPLVSIAESVKWLNENPHPELILLDINLTDGPSFEIFSQVSVASPVIFCTAYDEYALKAFELNSIDYLLKPVDPADLKRALDKFRKWQGQQETQDLTKLIRDLVNPGKKSRERFVIKVGDQLKIIKTESISFFTSSGKDTFLQNDQGRQYPLDESLDKLEPQLREGEFFRINRNYLIRLEAIANVRSYSNSRLRIELHHCEDNDILVSRDKTAAFKDWLAGE